MAIPEYSVAMTSAKVRKSRTTTAPRKRYVIPMILGYLVLLTGGTAVFLSSNSTGTAALIIAGVVLVALGLWGDRVRSFGGAGWKFDLENAAARDLQAAEQADNEGDTEEADRLRDRARVLLGATREMAAEYERIRAEMPSSWERTALMENVIQRARRLDAGASPIEVQQLFESGSEGNRMVALALIQADGKLATYDTLLKAVRDSKSAFEHFNALRASESGLLVGELTHEQRLTLRAAIDEKMRNGEFGAVNSDRNQMAKRVVEIVDNQAK